MRTDLVFKANASMDVYEPSVSEDPRTGDTVIEFVFSERQSGFVVSGTGGLYFTCRKAYKPLSRIADITDNYGVTLSPHRYLYITDTKPEMDFTGRVIGWRYTLRDDLPHDVVEQVATLNELADTQLLDPSAGDAH